MLLFAIKIKFTMLRQILIQCIPELHSYTGQWPKVFPQTEIVNLFGYLTYISVQWQIDSVPAIYSSQKHTIKHHMYCISQSRSNSLCFYKRQDE